MESPRYWREMPVNMAFVGVEKKLIEPDRTMRVFKYPGGEIPLVGSLEQIYQRFTENGFKSEVIEKILFSFFGAVASEATISFEKVVNSQDELVRSEVRKEGGGEKKLGVNRLPRKITRKTLFSACANH